MSSFLFPTLVFLFLVLFAGLLFWTNKKRHRLSAQDQKQLQAEWQRTLNELSSNPKGSVLEADKLLDRALTLKGYSGNLGEKLKKANAVFSSVNDVWHAHKLRNRIAHELNVKISQNEARQTLSYFKKALQDLGITI